MEEVDSYATEAEQPIVASENEVGYGQPQMMINGIGFVTGLWYVSSPCRLCRLLCFLLS